MLTTGSTSVNSDFGCFMRDFTDDNNAGDKAEGSKSANIEAMSAKRYKVFKLFSSFVDVHCC